MLGPMREKIISWGAKALFGLLILSFGMWGVSDYSHNGGGGGAGGVAQVGDTSISSHQFSRAMRQEMQRIRSVLGADLDPDQARAMGLADSVLQRLIQRDLFTLGAQEMGLLISDDGVRRDIQINRQFQGLTGQFDPNTFRQAMHSSGLTEASYVDSLRGDLLRGQFLSSIGVGGKVPDLLVNTVYQFRSQKRIASVLRIAASEFTISGTPGSEALAKFHTERAGLFTAPESRKLTVVELKASDLVDEIIVPEDKLQTAYDDRLDEFSEDEKRKIRQMLIGNETTAKLAHTRIAGGEDFAKVAKEVAGMDAAASDLGTVNRRQIPLPALGDVAFKLAKDELSQPTKSDLGWHILQVTEIVPASQKTFAEVKAELRKTLAEEASVDRISDLANKLEDQLGSGSALEAAARNLNLKVTEIDGVNSLGLRTDGKEVTGLLDLDAVLRTAFQTPGGEESTLQEIGEDAFFMLRVDKITPPTLRPLESVRGQVIAEWRRVEQAKLAEAEAKRIAADAGATKDLASYAKGTGVTHHTTPEFTRRGIGLKQALPPALLSGLFNAKRNEVTTAAAPDAYYVGRLKDIVQPNANTDRDGIAAIRSQLRQNYANDLAEQLATALRSRHTVTVNRASIDQAY